MDRLKEQSGTGIARATFIGAAITLGLAVAAFVLWKASIAFLLIFGGILLGVVFDSLARLMRRVLPIRRELRVLLSILLVAIVLGGAIFFGARALITQFGQLADVIEDQVQLLEDWLAETGLVEEGGEDGGLEGLLPDGSAIFGGATEAVITVFGGLGNFVLLIFLGIFFAMEPHLYQRGVVALFPKPRRERAAEILHEAGTTLRYWLVGQSISMSIIFLVSLVVLMLIGMPFAVLLAVQAGLFAFIPLLGPVLAGVPIVLAGVSVSPHMALLGLGAYVLIQSLESYTIQPIVQERAVSLPPALTLSLQLVLGVLFGFVGVALAVPLGAAVRRIIELGYVHDALGGGIEEDGRGEPGAPS